MLRNTLMLAIMLVACGDNEVPPDARQGHPFPPEPVGPITTGTGCADFDINVVCDAAVEGPDAGDVTDDPELKASCCHALLDGEPPKFECGYPPGICHSGRHDLHCGELTFTLCNP